MTFAEYVRRRERSRLDVSLVFVALSVVVLSAWAADLGFGGAWVELVSAAFLLAHPALLLRVVDHFQPVHMALRVGAPLAFVASLALLVGLPHPTPAGPALAMLLYFVVVEGYAAVAFVRGALEKGGVTRQRLRFAAMGTGLVASVFLLGGAASALPSLAGAATAATPLLSAGAGVAFFVGFAPPSRLVLSWQLRELHHFLRSAHAETLEARAEAMTRSLAESSKRAAGGLAAIVLLDEAGDRLAVRSRAGRAFDFPARVDATEGAVSRAFRERAAVVESAEGALSAAERAALDALDARALYAIPIASPARRAGVLLVLLRRGVRDPADDVALLSLIGEQAALAIEHASLLREERALAERLAAANDELRRSNADLERFAYVASHDLQEPLRNVAVNAQRLAREYEGRLDASADEQIGFIVGGVRDMRDLIADILEYSVVGSRTGEPRIVDLGEPFDRAVKDLGAAIDEARASVTRAALPVVRADPREMALVFQNLVANAVKFRKGEGPRVEASAMRAGGEWVVSVKDDGIGIDPRFAERIFVPFQRLHTKEAYPGTGIGLAIAKKIVERHGGRIWVESKPGAGATFRFTLPAG